jgi:hypothetical protein
MLKVAFIFYGVNQIYLANMRIGFTRLNDA